jgi:hypothetical protein
MSVAGYGRFFFFYLLSFMKKHPVNNNQETNEEHENGNPVDPVHIAYPGTGRLIRISFP